MIGELVAVLVVVAWVLVVCTSGRAAPLDASRFLQWLWREWDIKSSNQGQNVIAPLCTLSIAISAGLVALITFLRETGLTQLTYMWYLVVAILIPWLIMVRIITAKTSTGARYVDWISLRLGTVLALGFIPLVAFVVMKGRAGTLPGQPVPRAHSIKASEALAHASIKPSGIAATIHVDDLYPNGRIPNRMNFVFDLQEPLLARKWELLEIRVEVVDDRGATTLVERFPSESNDKGVRTHAQAMVLQSEANKHYLVKMFLRSTTEYNGDQIDKDAALIREGRGVRISDRSEISSN